MHPLTNSFLCSFLSCSFLCLCVHWLATHTHARTKQRTAVFVSFFPVSVSSKTSQGLGLCSGVVLYTGAQWAKKLGFVRGSSLNPNTGMLVVLSSFAFGTFFMASTTGKELVHTLHPVFEAGWAEPPNTLALPKLGKSSNTNTNDHQETTAAVDPQRLRELRITRRKSLLETHGIGGSSNIIETANNNIDPEHARVDPQRLRELRITRRKSLMETLHQRGHGISDSHSGRWVEENSETKFEKG